MLDVAIICSVMCMSNKYIILFGSSISRIGIHLDSVAINRWIRWISIHFYIVTHCIIFTVNTVLSYLFFLLTVPIPVIHSSNDDTDQCSKNKCDNKINVATILMVTATPVERSSSSVLSSPVIFLPPMHKSANGKINSLFAMASYITLLAGY